jgi:CDP-diacylglycerol--glycerol-3-phosphate 3-phosphatidyltransferase
MTDLGRAAVLGHLAVAAASLAAFAVVRPPAPARLAGRTGPLAAAGRWVYWTTRPLVTAAHGLGLSADALTWLGLLGSTAAGWQAARGAWGLAGVLLVWGSLCDLLDGELARAGGTAGPPGAFLDSTLDRVAEMALLGGVAAGLEEGAAWAVAALAASLMVSYARARGEGLGVACPTFGMERPHRLVVLMAALLVAPFLAPRAADRLVEAGCVLVAVGAGITALGRILVIHRLLRRGPGGAGEGA